MCHTLCHGTVSQHAKNLGVAQTILMKVKRPCRAGGIITRLEQIAYIVLREELEQPRVGLQKDTGVSMGVVGILILTVEHKELFRV